jgi:PhnB protein
MISDVSEFARPGFHSITPYLAVHGAARLIEFVKSAFGAEELMRSTGSLGGIHAEMRIGDSILMIGGDAPVSFDDKACPLHLYVPDADAVYERALAAGATSLKGPVDQSYGDREAGVNDPTGNSWWIATHRAGASHRPEGLRSLTPFLHPRGADRVIDFLERAFGAEVALRHESPDGAVRHAMVRIGDSMLELGEAHGDYQPQPAMFYFYVPDVDAIYRQALEAGSTSLGEPADQPYGDRTAAIEDPFGNSWYLATHAKGVAP